MGQHLSYPVNCLWMSPLFTLRLFPNMPKVLPAPDLPLVVKHDLLGSKLFYLGVSHQAGRGRGANWANAKTIWTEAPSKPIEG